MNPKQSTIPKNLLTKAALLITLTFFLTKSLTTTQHPLTSDAKAYYAYLPSTIIHQDQNFNFTQNLPPKTESLIWYSKTSDNKKYIKMAIGTAVCQLPGFLIAHTLAKLHDDYQPTGYDTPYYEAIRYNAVFFAIWGLWFLGLVLRRWFDDHVVALALLLLVFATNFSFYVTHHPGYAHVYSFWACALFLYAMLEWYDRPRFKMALLVGFAAGMLVLIRPTNILFLMLFPLWNLHAAVDIKAFFRFSIKHYRHLIVITVTSLLLFSLQMLYWKWSVDQWWFYSYGDEGFFFSNPHVTDFLFSYRKGWLLYTPVMVLSIMGIFVLNRKVKAAKWAIPLLFCVFVYVLSSWQAWWYGDAYSQRPMVDIYPVLAIPLAAFIAFVLMQKRVLLTGLLALFLIGTTVLNLFQEQQYKDGLIHYDGMTKEAYWAIWGETKFPPDYNDLIVLPNVRRSMIGKEEYISSVVAFEVTDSLYFAINETLDASRLFSKPVAIPLADKGNPDKRMRIKCSLLFDVDALQQHDQFSFWVTAFTAQKGASYRVDPWKSNVRGTGPYRLSRTIDLWPPFSPTDSLKMAVEYRFGPPVKVQGIRVKFFEAAYPN